MTPQTSPAASPSPDPVARGSTTTGGALLPPAVIQPAQARAQSLVDGLDAVIFGQSELTRMVVVAVLARGNVLLEGLPGLGKTELVKALAHLVGLDFKRLQFTPDLLPSDVTERLQKRFRFYTWDTHTGEVRWMCSFDTTENDVDTFAAALAEEMSV